MHAFPVAFGIWGTCICRMQLVWLLDYFSSPWFPGITVLPALLLPPDVDLSSQLFHNIFCQVSVGIP